MMVVRGWIAAMLVWIGVLAGALAFGITPAAAEECPNTAFRTGPSTHLPDCRAYELVTPPFKNLGEPGLRGLSPDGSSMLLEISTATAGLEGFPGGPLEAFYSTRRTASGWTTMPDDPPSSEYQSAGEERGATGLMAWSLDGQTTVWAERAGLQFTNGGALFLRRPDHSIVEVGPFVPPTVPSLEAPALGGQAGIAVGGMSSDASHLIFNLNNFYWPFDGTLTHGSSAGGGGSMYEYVGTGNTTPMLVAVNDSGELIGQCGNELAAANGDEDGGTGHEGGQNAVSADGDTVFFRVLPKHDGCEGSAPPVVELFARIDNGLPDARTVAISEPTEEDCSVCYENKKLISAGQLAKGEFLAASEDGSKVFFRTAQPLLPGATGENIYEYDFDAPAGERIVRVTGGAPDPELLSSETQPVVSQDGSHVYFLAQGVLTTAPNGQREAAAAGANNLYVFERDAEYPVGRIAFVTRLSQADLEPWRSAQTTPDGGFLVFLSERDLTPDTTSTGVRQVFEYDAQTGALVRVSIGQEGFNHDGNVPPINPFGRGTYNNVNNAEIAFHGGFEKNGTSAYWTGLSMSADGSYVFFQSTVGLTPQALNQQVIGHTNEQNSREHLPIYAMNVYEYHAGRVSLISDGQDLTHNFGQSLVRLIGTDESGGDAFFMTTDRLVGQASDVPQVDIYDARIDGGFPASAVAPSCSGEECQGALGGAPTLLSPGSEFQAGGNLPLGAPAPAAVSKPKAKAKPKKCKKGTKREHGRCVTRRAKARKASGDRRAES
jgi:hypothetical protein